MSIVIAGKECIICGNKWYISYSGPKWYKDHIYKKKKSPQVRRWHKLAKSRVCMSCLFGVIEPGELAVHVLKRIEYGNLRRIKRR